MKNLSEVLNEVMTDIFTEAGEKGPFGGSNNIVSTSELDPKTPLDQVFSKEAVENAKAEAAAKALAASKDKVAAMKAQQDAVSGVPGAALDAANPGVSVMKSQQDALRGQDLSYLEQLKQGASNLGSTIAQGATDAGSYLAQKGQEAAAAYQSMPDYLQYGIPAAALAAGAGALYLRKKQKAANKAAGIR